MYLCLLPASLLHCKGGPVTHNDAPNLKAMEPKSRASACEKNPTARAGLESHLLGSVATSITATCRADDKECRQAKQGSPLPLRIKTGRLILQTRNSHFEAAAPVSMQIDFNCVRFALAIDAELCIHGYAAHSLRPT